MKPRSIRFKITILYTAILGVILLVYSVLLYVNLSRVIYREIDKKLKMKLIEVEWIFDAYTNLLAPNEYGTALPLKRALHLEDFEKQEAFQWPSIKKADQDWKYKIQMLGIKEDYIVVYYPSGEVIEKSGNVSNEIAAILKKNFPRETVNSRIISYMGNDVYLRIISRPYYRWGRIKYVIQLATPLDAHLFILRSKLELILMTIPAVLFFTSFLGRFFVIKIFQPITEIIQTAQTISHEDMSKRVVLSHADEEIRLLVDGFNDMIERLEKAFKYTEEFSSNVAHELKTPLAIIRGELEVVLRKEYPPEEYRRAITVSLEEVQRMLRTINDLLLLARLNSRTEVFTFETVDLIEFLTEIHEQIKVVANGKKISVELDVPTEKLSINANQLHLRRLFFNLLDNAIKFTPQGGLIKISLVREEDFALVRISDTGIGISDEDLPKIFDRFFHSDQTGHTPSATGLGLSIVQSIAKIHHGSIDVESELGRGTTFTTKLPLVLRQISSY